MIDSTRADIVFFRMHQWQLLRVLLLRRYASLTGNPEAGRLLPFNVTAALRAFQVAPTPASLLSRPYKYHDVREAAGTKLAGLDSNEAFLHSVDRGDLRMPTDVVITAVELASIDALALHERACGYNPNARQQIPGGAGGVRHDGHLTAPGTPVAETGSEGTARSNSSATVKKDSQRVISAAPGSMGFEHPLPLGIGGGAMPAAPDWPTLAMDTNAIRSREQLLISRPQRVSEAEELSAMAAIAADLVSDRRYKTKLCHAFQRGHCTRGLRCDYAHGEHELRVMHVSSMCVCVILFSGVVL